MPCCPQPRRGLMSPPHGLEEGRAMQCAPGHGSLSRRHFMQSGGIAGLALVAGCGRLPWQAHQPAKVPRIGFLLARPLSAPPDYLEPFRRGLHDLGYVEGQNIDIEVRSAEGEAERLPTLAAE